MIESHSAPSVAIVGATGAVGVELIHCLEHRRFPLRRLRLFASARSAGRELRYGGEALTVEVLTEESLRGTDLALFSAGSAVSRQFAPPAARRGTLVIDNSSAFRMDPDVPLVVPEINAAAAATHRGIIANPNCVAIIAAVSLWPLHCEFGIRRIIASTYQAASGAGAAAMEELLQSTRAALAGEPFTPRVLRHPYAFNLYSHDSAVDPASGCNEEETKVMRELRRILSIPQLPVSVTCIRVPVLRAHAISLTVQFERPVTAAAARARLAAASGVRLIDDAAGNHFPMPLEASGQGEVLVGRLRLDTSDASGHSLSLFVAGDQLLKGAALNAVQIAEAVARALD
ncbi:MAG TPA: aspartate-semialdehyde dehydrogenase [Steroidobacteraceae bacterium]|jgi:aspartate-semialdehyde dehydrogenase|nr:aspartate-semialdehyde dehydrogenase [Steroidobacteraceae bacterium]